MSYKNNQKGSSVSSGIKSNEQKEYIIMSETIKKEPNINSGTEKLK